MTASAVVPARRGAGALLRIAFNVFVTGGAVWFLWVLLRDIEIRAVVERLRHAGWGLVAVVIAANVVRLLLLGLRWEILVRKEAPVGYWATQEILMAGNFVQIVAPGLRVAGPVMRAFYLSKETGRPRARFYGTIVADQTANFSIFAAAMVVSGIITASRGQAGLTPGAGAGLMFALVGGLWVGRRQLLRFKHGDPSLMRQLLDRVMDPRGPHARPGSVRERFLSWWDHLLEALAHSMVGTGTFWPAIFVSAAVFLASALSQSLSCTAIGAPLTLAAGAFAVAAGAFIQMMAAAPGGPGVTEASLVVMLLALGLDAESAAAGTLLARIVNYAVVLPWGGVCFWRLQRHYGRVPDTEEEPEEAAARL